MLPKTPGELRDFVKNPLNEKSLRILTQNEISINGKKISYVVSADELTPSSTAATMAMLRNFFAKFVPKDTLDTVHPIANPNGAFYVLGFTSKNTEFHGLMLMITRLRNYAQIFNEHIDKTECKPKGRARAFKEAGEEIVQQAFPSRFATQQSLDSFLLAINKFGINCTTANIGKVDCGTNMRIMQGADKFVNLIEIANLLEEQKKRGRHS